MFCVILRNNRWSHLGIPNCEKLKLFHAIIILAESWINFNQRFLKYCHFHVCAIFSNGPWHPLWIVQLFNLEKKSILLFLLFFSNGGHLGHLAWPTFTIPRPWSQFMLHVKFANCRSSSFLEEDVWTICFQLLTGNGWCKPGPSCSKHR